MAIGTSKVSTIEKIDLPHKEAILVMTVCAALLNIVEILLLKKVPLRDEETGEQIPLYRRFMTAANAKAELNTVLDVVNLVREREKDECGRFIPKKPRDKKTGKLIPFRQLVEMVIEKDKGKGERNEYYRWARDGVSADFYLNFYLPMLQRAVNEGEAKGMDSTELQLVLDNDKDNF
ncbi:MAG: hypothetical protein IJ529_00985 [Alphaproteobacteria bacterium]|nr:hypothetical protein [Alphaproteobacteria bacterium]MBQ9234868.1 hypothetical protein [Alphaproteobacteria bacterium]